MTVRGCACVQGYMHLLSITSVDFLSTFALVRNNLDGLDSFATTSCMAHLRMACM